VLGDFAAAASAGRVLVALEGDMVVGAVVLYPPGSGRDLARDGEAELSRLAVNARSRGRGIGRALAERCVAAARAAGADGLVLWSRPHQNMAHRLYESLGFRRDPRRDREDVGGPQWVFRLRL
jgi:ribosomal protein S18 acetylase RimI-like enzyme